MRTYLLLKERAAAFRADPEVQAALAAARSPSSPSRRSPRARRYADLLADRSAFEDFDTDAYSPARASASSASTSWPPSTCSAPADRIQPADSSDSPSPWPTRDPDDSMRG